MTTRRMLGVKLAGVWSISYWQRQEPAALRRSGERAGARRARDGANDRFVFLPGREHDHRRVGDFRVGDEPAAQLDGQMPEDAHAVLAIDHLKPHRDSLDVGVSDVFAADIA